MITLNPNIQPVGHGGNLEDAIKRYGIPKPQWLDLSTGISPWAYPVANLPEYVWQELPPSNSKLLATAAQYYDVKSQHITVTPGSQLAIRLIPQLFKPSSVGVPALGYQEHAASWKMAKHQVLTYHNTTELLELIANKQVEHAVMINPNNPSGEKIALDTIGKIASTVSGVCIIDEAFIDQYDITNVASATQFTLDNSYNKLIILRSIGKFFGLAGIRLGFAIGAHAKLPALNALLEPWSISHVSQHIGIQALQDKQWQQQQKNNIRRQQETFRPVLKNTLNQYLRQYSIAEVGLFNTVFSDEKLLSVLHHQLAKKGIWTRLGNKDDQPSWLRFGLPRNITQFEKLSGTENR